jgi:hypothetical protein
MSSDYVLMNITKEGFKSGLLHVVSFQGSDDRHSQFQQALTASTEISRTFRHCKKISEHVQATVCVWIVVSVVCICRSSFGLTTCLPLALNQRQVIVERDKRNTFFFFIINMALKGSVAN